MTSFIRRDRKGTSTASLFRRDPETDNKIAQIANDLRTSKSQYVDKDFAANDAAIWGAEAAKTKQQSEYWLRDQGEIRWLRPDEFGDTSVAWKVFQDGINPDDIQQGLVGDCYFLAALGAIAVRPELIDQLIVEEHADVGIYGVKFFRMGRWETVIIDDLFPCSQESDSGKWTPLFARYTEPEKEIWMMLAEKAWAKFHGSYQVINNGMVPDTLCYLTGGHMDLFVIEDQEVWASMLSGRLWNRLFSMFNKTSSEDGVFLSCSGMQEDDKSLEIGGGAAHGSDDGLKGDHAYSVLDLKQVDGLHLMKIRNPWGSFEWQGDYGDSSPLWTPQLKKACGWENKNDGSFWMKFEDFCDRFSFIGGCRTHATWKYQSVGGSWSAGASAGGRYDETFAYNPTYLLKNTNSTVVLQVEQEDIRNKSPHERTFSDVFVNVIAKSPNKEYPDVSDTVAGLSDEFDSTPGPFRTHSSGRVSGIEMILEPGEYHIVVTQYHPGFEGDFTLNVYSAGSFTLDDVTPTNVPPEAKRVMAKRDLKSAKPVCCMTGAAIDLSKPSSYRTKKFVFWDVRQNERNFRCGSCLKPFDASTHFYDIGQEQGKPFRGYCADCFKEIFFSRCALCALPIVSNDDSSGKFVKVERGRLHKECWLEYKLKTSKSNVVCQIPLEKTTIDDGYIAVAVRVRSDKASLAKLKQALE
eukprot:c10106_g1_i1.p1 GENE.c10106_g1_i1~~c10106_g1_i1.p1  ORF type:complete len:691 (+),score=163.56 c10106_g1_i1:113-2185(+)